MPRHPRVHAPNLLYHLIARGNNGQEIYYDRIDYQKFIDLLLQTRKNYPFKLYAYVLMPNHFHLLIEVVEKPASRIMQSLLTGYARYFNRAHLQYGHLFQGRYKGIVCDKENYFLALVSYIHLNPVRAKLAEEPGGWEWSGHREYTGRESRKLIDFELFESLFGKGETGYQRYKLFLEDSLGRSYQEGYYPKDSRPFLGGSKFACKLEVKKSPAGSGPRKSLEELEAETENNSNLIPGSLKARNSTFIVVAARKAFIRKSINKYNYAQTEVARFLGFTPSYILKVVREDGNIITGVSEDSEV